MEGSQENPNPVPVTTVQASEDSMELLQVLIKLADPQAQGGKQQIITHTGGGDHEEQMQAVASIVSADGSRSNAIMVVEGATVDGQGGTVAELAGAGDGIDNVVVHFTEGDGTEQNILVPVNQQLEAGEVVGVAQPKKMLVAKTGEKSNEEPDEPTPELVMGKIFRYKCNMCPMMYESQEALQKHMAAEMQLKKYVCEDCGKRFKSKEGFRSHRRIHTGETPYRCDPCDKKFNNRTAFRYHQELKHSTEEFVCMHCPKIFQTRQCLRKHLVIAHGQKLPSRADKKKAKQKKKELKKLLKLKKAAEEKLKIKQEAVDGEVVSDVPQEGTTASDVTSDGNVVSDVPPDKNIAAEATVKGEAPPEGSTAGEVTSQEETVDISEIMDGVSLSKFMVTVKLKEKEKKDKKKKRMKKKGRKKKKRLALMSSDGTIKLRRPQKTAHLIRAFRCEHCPGQYTLRKNLFKHIRAKHPDQAPPKPSRVSWSCDFCGAAMKTKTYKREHERIHTGERPYSCRLGCTKSFSRTGARNEHERSVHLKENKATCQVCNKTFDRREMRHHVTIHTGEKPFRCPYCQNSYTQKKIMNKHIRRTHPGHEIPAPIPRKKKDPVVKELVQQQNENETIAINIAAADGDTGDADVERLQERFIQSGDNSDVMKMQVYKCKYCEKLFNDVTHLTNHENIHIQTKHYQCGTCGKTFKRPEGLTRHIGKHTGGFQCSNCGIYLPTYTKLQQHEEEHLFKCKMCKRKYETKAELTEHMQVHMKNTDRYQCMHCMKILATKSSLREHEKIHLDKVTCEICHKEFVSHYMKKHMRTHNGDHPYLCQHCPDRRYTTPNALRVHMRRRHSANAARTDYQATIVINQDMIKEKAVKSKDVTSEVVIHPGVQIQDLPEGLQLHVSEHQDIGQQQHEVQLQVSQGHEVQPQIIQQVQVIPQEVVHQEVVGSHQQITQQQVLQSQLATTQQVHITHDGQQVAFTMPSNYQPPSYNQVTQQATNSQITLTNVPQEQLYINIPYQQVQQQQQPQQQQQAQQQQQQFHY